MNCNRFYLLNTLLYFAGELVEYCISESFRASCSPDHVIVMTTATYGKTHNGRCARAGHGANGCRSDVIWVLDRYCSGTNSCEMPIPNRDLERATGCPKDLGNFLLAEYRCMDSKYEQSQWI